LFTQEILKDFVFHERVGHYVLTLVALVAYAFQTTVSAYPFTCNISSIQHHKQLNE